MNKRKKEALVSWIRIQQKIGQYFYSSGALWLNIFQKTEEVDDMHSWILTFCVLTSSLNKIKEQHIHLSWVTHIEAVDSW